MPLTNDDIQKAVQRYEREYDRYVKLTEVVYEQCLRIVDEMGVRATVQRRTKSPQSLRKKLLRIQRQTPADARFSSVDDVFTHMGDLSAVRVGPYLESDRGRVVEELKKEFEFAPATQDHPNPDEKNKNGRAKHYRAIHCQAFLTAKDLDGPNSNLAGTSCEIQVCSMLAHVWNEIEHDLGYKPETGTLSERELDCLDALGQLVRAGDVIIKTLLEANSERVVAIETPFSSQFDFMARMQKQFPSATEFHHHAAQLYDALLGLGLDSPKKVIEELLGAGNDYQARAEELVQRLKDYVDSVGDGIVEVKTNTSDQLAVLLFDKKLKELRNLIPSGRGTGRPLRLVSLAKRFEDMNTQAAQAAPTAPPAAQGNP